MFYLFVCLIYPEIHLYRDPSPNLCGQPSVQRSILQIYLTEMDSCIGWTPPTSLEISLKIHPPISIEICLFRYPSLLCLYIWMPVQGGPPISIEIHLCRDPSSRIQRSILQRWTPVQDGLSISIGIHPLISIAVHPTISIEIHLSTYEALTKGECHIKRTAPKYSCLAVHN